MGADNPTVIAVRRVTAHPITAAYSAPKDAPNPT